MVGLERCLLRVDRLSVFSLVLGGGDLERDHWCWFLLEVGSQSGVDQAYPGCALGFWCWFLIEVGSPSAVFQGRP